MSGVVGAGPGSAPLPPPARRLLPAPGVGSPGLIDMRSAVIQSATEVRWFEAPLTRNLESRIDLEMYVANRSKVGALGERCRAAASAATSSSASLSSQETQVPRTLLNAPFIPAAANRLRKTGVDRRDFSNTIAGW